MVHPDAFATQGDFNEQLYLALKQSPWWMISIAVHVMVFFILTLFDSSGASGPAKKPIQASMAAEQVEEDLEDTDEDIIFIYVIIL